jgi:hypothetical protein
LADDAELCDLKREALPELTVGTLVTINAGAMAGLRGEVLSDDGMVTMVQMEMFGRRMSIRMARAMLAEGSSA